MSIRKFINKAKEAQAKAGMAIPMQLALFPPRLVPWEDCICRKGAWNPDCPKHPKT